MFGLSVLRVTGECIDADGEGSRLSSSSCREPELVVVLGGDAVLELNGNSASSPVSTVAGGAVGVAAGTCTVGKRVVSG